MAIADTVSIDAATPADAALLENLLELYSHDLSGIFANVALGPDGRFGYPKLALYWSEPDRRFAFVIRAGEQIAGFVLVTRGSPAMDDPEVLDVAEFFVLRRYRRTGVGRRAAALLWRRLPGRWTVRVSESNSQGLAFWGRVVDDVARGRARVFTRLNQSVSWRIYTFNAARSDDAG